MTYKIKVISLVIRRDWEEDIVICACATRDIAIRERDALRAAHPQNSYDIEAHELIEE